MIVQAKRPGLLFRSKCYNALPKEESRGIVAMGKRHLSVRPNYSFLIASADSDIKE